MKLTKEQAILEHRKMWNWIADQYKNGRKENIYDLKREYCEEKNLIVKCFCFCCEYVHQNKLCCEQCPIQWETVRRRKTDECTSGIYFTLELVSLYRDMKVKKCERLARRIADLPERK